MVLSTRLCKIWGTHREIIFEYDDIDYKESFDRNMKKEK